MKQRRALLLPPGWDASPSQGYPQQYVTGTHLYTWVERDRMGKVPCLRKQHDDRDWASNHQPSDLKSNALTTTPPLPRYKWVLVKIGGGNPVMDELPI